MTNDVDDLFQRGRVTHRYPHDPSDDKPDDCIDCLDIKF